MFIFLDNFLHATPSAFHQFKSIEEICKERVTTFGRYIHFSIFVVIAVLTESLNPQTYWRTIKKRLKDEGNETVTNCNALKMHIVMLFGKTLMTENDHDRK